MKKFFAVTLLSVSLCISQAGGAWASTQTHFPPPVSSSTGADVGTQWWVPTVTVLIAGIALLLLIEWDEKMRANWSEDDDENITGVCDFYEDNREDDEYMLEYLGGQLWETDACPHLFDDDGYDIDDKGERIWPKN